MSSYDSGNLIRKAHRMSNLMPRDILDDVRAVLERASKGRGSERHYLTAYQILAELPSALRDTLIQQRGLPGVGAGVHYSAASLVSDAAEQLAGIEKAYLDSRHTSFQIDQHVVAAGYGVSGLYRLP
jgi:hypothetical protein